MVDFSVEEKKTSEGFRTRLIESSVEEKKRSEEFHEELYFDDETMKWKTCRRGGCHDTSELHNNLRFKKAATTVSQEGRTSMLSNESSKDSKGETDGTDESGEEGSELYFGDDLMKWITKPKMLDSLVSRRRAALRKLRGPTLMNGILKSARRTGTVQS